MKEERKLSSLNLALVLVHDLLLAKGIQAGDGPIKQAVLRHKTRLHGEFQKVKIKRGASSNIDLADNGDERAALIPRYVRVNSVLGTTESAIENFVSRGFILSDPFFSKKGFSRDLHIPDLLLFSPQTTFTTDPLYLSGKIILQDKASCFPAIVLSPPATDESVVIDATAAPGNKTSHLSALMGNKGKVTN
jgi:putative methyltransferase